MQRTAKNLIREGDVLPLRNKKGIDVDVESSTSRTQIMRIDGEVIVINSSKFHQMVVFGWNLDNSACG